MRPGRILKRSAGKWQPIILLLAALLMLAILPACQGKANNYRSTEEVTAKEKQGVVTFDITIDTPENAGKVSLWLPYVTSNDYQTIEDVSVEGNFDYSGVYREAEHGIISLYAEWDEPKGDARLTYSFKITRKEIIMKNFPKEEGPIPVEIEQYLLPTSLGPTTGDVKDVAVKVTKGQKTILGKAIAIYDYIVEEGERNPDIKGCGIGDVEALLQDLSGKCSDISSVFVAMAKSVGVPAREILGIRMAQEGDITGAYHCRAEFYLPGYGWVPVDPSDVLKFMLTQGCSLADPKTAEARQYFFGAQTETYIDFYPGRDVILSPAQGGDPLNYFMYPYAEVNGKHLPFTTPGHPVSQEGLKYTVTFRGL